MSISFDRAADFYDATRGFPADVQERIGRALLDAAGATQETRILEPGVGTGRIALPIIRAGHRYTGIDVSPRMLEKLRAAVAGIAGAEERVTLVQGDAVDLPFGDGSFDVVVTVNVLHLVSDRARAIDEELRVLARPGILLDGREEHPREDRAVYRAWRDTLRDLGWPPAGHAVHAPRSPAQEWRQRGGEVDSFMAVEWQEARAPAQDVEYVARREWSGTWSAPDAIFARAARQLRAWAGATYGAALDTPVPRTRGFIIDRGRFT